MGHKHEVPILYDINGLGVAYVDHAHVYGVVLDERAVAFSDIEEVKCGQVRLAGSRERWYRLFEQLFGDAKVDFATSLDYRPRGL